MLQADPGQPGQQLKGRQGGAELRLPGGHQAVTDQVDGTHVQPTCRVCGPDGGGTLGGTLSGV